MKSIELRAFAKVNLSLDVTGVREDGYHLMDMVNISASLSDRLLIRQTPGSEFSIGCNLRYIPTGEKNLIWKAAAALAAAAGERMPQVRCEVKKVIPTQAGLGGGSADAAAALIGLNELMGLGMSRKQLCAIGEKVGADVPYCIKGGPARVRGIGEIIEPVSDNCTYRLVIVMPRKGRSTSDAFAALDKGTGFVRPDTGKVLEGLKNGDMSAVAEGARNVFEEVSRDPVTEAIKERLFSLGCVHAAMSGTGSSVFGIFRGEPDSAQACVTLREEGYSAWDAAPVRCGVKIIR